MKSSKQINQILLRDFSVGSGVYSAVDSRIKMKLNKRGEYRAVLPKKMTENGYEELAKVDIMSDISVNESIISRDLFSDDTNMLYDPIIGYYSELYAGYVAEGDYRKNGSSGGMTTWVLSELINKKLIDFAIHATAVDPKKNKGILFKYVISDHSDSIKNGSKSRYYPMELSEVLKIVSEIKGRYAVVGIPEFISEVRLLCRTNKLYEERIVYMIGLVCGHQKTTKYAEALAWQNGIKPGELKKVDFRVKQKGRDAMDYLHHFESIKGDSFNKDNSELFAGFWPAGFFKSKFSDFTDDVFNETADITLGDAWLQEYIEDCEGTNIVIVRNKTISLLIKNAVQEGRLKLDSVNEEHIKRSQKGLIRHSRDELPYRLYNESKTGWIPKKRVAPSGDLDQNRKDIQDLRMKISRESHHVYAQALEKKEWSYFEDTFSPMLKKYNILYSEPSQTGSVQVSEEFKFREKAKYEVSRMIAKARQFIRPRTRIKHLKNKYYHHKFKDANGAILTLTGYYNYGNLLQRYALQRFLYKQDILFYSIWNDQLGLDEHPERIVEMKRFVDQYIVTKSFSRDQKYLNYIVGSDQVWRNWGYDNLNSDLGYYFVNFDDNPEANIVSYAASFGKDTAEDANLTIEFINYIKPYIDRFKHVSVREFSGISILNKNWGKQASHVLDPTMLLEKTEYDKLINDCATPLYPVAEIFTYILAEEKIHEFITSKIMSHYGYQVTSIDPNPNVKKLQPVEQWLMGFRDSKIVITDSFHGTVFSILNNTEFFVIENSLGGVGRIEGLLSELGISGRVIYTTNIESYDFRLTEPIRWNEVNKKLDYLRRCSSDWLLNSVKN